MQRHPYRWVFGAGFLYYGLATSWMYGIKTAELASGAGVWVMVWSAAIIIASTMALGPLLFLWFVKTSKLSVAKPWFVPAISLLWALCEYLRAVFFSIVSFGPGGSIGPHWTTGHLGYGLVGTPFVYIARWGGVYLLSVCVAALFSGLLVWFSRRSAKPFIGVVMVMSVLTFSGYYIWQAPRANDPTKTVTIFGFAEVPSKEQNSARVIEHLNKATVQPADIVVLPEYSELWTNEPEQDALSMQQLVTSDATIVDSVRERTNNAIGHNLVVLRKDSGEVISSQQKSFLIPGGEYIPYIYQLLLAYTGQDQLIRNFNNQRTVQKAERSEKPMSQPDVVFGSFACSAVMSPDSYRAVTSDGATLLTNSASLNTLGIGSQFHGQSETMAKLHSIANARPFAQAARGGASYIFDHNGNKLADIGVDTGFSTAQATVQLMSQKTAYSILGDWVIWIGVGLAICLGVVHFKNKRHNVRITKRKLHASQKNPKGKSKENKK